MILLWKISQFCSKLRLSDMTNKQIPGTNLPVALNMISSLNRNYGKGTYNLCSPCLLRTWARILHTSGDFQHLSQNHDQNNLLPLRTPFFSRTLASLVLTTNIQQLYPHADIPEERKHCTIASCPWRTRYHPDLKTTIIIIQVWKFC